MSDNKHTLKNRFDNFEPEVDDAVIDQNWQKLNSKLLAEKETKKGFVFWLSISLLVLLIGLSAVITTQMLFDNESNSSLSEKKSDPTNLQSATTDETSTTSENKINHKDIAHNNNETENNPNDLSNSNSNNASKNKITSQSSYSAGNIKGDVSNSNQPKITNNNKSSIASNSSFQKTNTSPTKATNRSSDDDLLNHSNQKNFYEEPIEKTQKDKVNSNITNSTHQTLNLPQNNDNNTENEYSYLRSIPVYFNDSLQTNEITSSIISSYSDTSTNNTTENKKHHFSFDIYGGTALNQIKTIQLINNNSTVLNSKNLNFSGGLSLNYHVSNKLISSLDYNYTSYNLSSSLDDNKTVGYSKYVRNYKNVGDTTNKKDVIEKQFLYNQSFNLSSNQIHLIGLGLSYNILNKSKWNVTTGITVNCKINRFTYSKQANLNTTDTIIVASLNQSSSDTTIYSSFVTNSTSDYKSLDYNVKNDFKTSIGITPNVMLGYSINNKLSLFIKASYYFDLSSNKIINKELENRIKQNILFAHFGVRLKL